MLNPLQARDEMRTLFRERLASYLANGLPNEQPAIPAPVFRIGRSNTVYNPLTNIYWSKTESVEETKVDQHWMRFYNRNVSKRQSAFSGGRTDEIGTRKRTKGFVTVEIFLSKSSYETESGDALVYFVERCFHQAGTPCGVWFRGAVTVELEDTETYFRSNVIAEYEYDSLIR